MNQQDNMGACVQANVNVSVHAYAYMSPCTMRVCTCMRINVYLLIVSHACPLVKACIPMPVLVHSPFQLKLVTSLGINNLDNPFYCIHEAD